MFQCGVSMVTQQLRKFTKTFKKGARHEQAKPAKVVKKGLRPSMTHDIEVRGSRFEALWSIDKRSLDM